MSNAKNVFEQTLEFQKNFVNTWLENVKEYSEKIGTFDQKKIVDWYEDTIDATKDMFSEWTKNSTWDMVTPQQSVQSDIYNKLMSSTKVYEDLFNLYTKFAEKNSYLGTKEIFAFLGEQKSAYDKMIEDIFGPLFPQGSKLMFSSSNAIIEQLKEISENFTSSFTDMAKSNSEAVKKMIDGSFEQYKEAYRSIVNVYENSYGKYLKTMGIPFTDDADPAIGANLEAFKNMYLAQTQLLAYVKDVAQNNMADVIKQYQEFVKPGNQPKTMGDFVDLFINVNDKVFIDLMAQDEFCDLFANYIKQFSLFKKDFNELLEKNLSWLPFTPISQMDYVYKTIHDLRKQVYYNNKTIEELSAKLAALGKKTK